MNNNMTMQEFSVIVATLTTMFPSRYFLQTKDAVNLWYEYLKDIPYTVLSNAVKYYIDNYTDIPKIATLRDICANITAGRTDDWGNGWGIVVKAIGMYGYFREEEALEYIKEKDPVAHDTIVRLGWESICMSESQETDRANFRMIYQQQAARKKEERVLQPELLKLVQAASNSTSFESRIEQKDRDRLPMIEEEETEHKELPSWLKERMSKRVGK